MNEISKDDWLRLSKSAWKVRENASIIGKTKVGAAVLDDQKHIHLGCNIEHVFRSHDIHAEVNAISNMVAAGHNRFKAILIVAKREFFTPCGACMDWIMQYGGKEALVGFQSTWEGKIEVYTASELMPFYPR